MALVKTSQTEHKPVKKTGRYARTPYTNLVRAVASGAFVARFRVGGKLIRRSLNTNVLPVARLRLADIEKQERHLMESAHNVAAGRLTFCNLAKIFSDRVQGNRSLKPLTIKNALKPCSNRGQNWNEWKRAP
jgi:hypothetical protein